MSMTFRRAGYTLVEVMATVAIVGVAMGMGAQLFIQFQKFYIASIARTELQRDGRVALDLMTKMIRQASLSSVSITTTGTGYFSRIDYQTPDQRVWAYYQSGPSLIQEVRTPPAATVNVSTLTKNLGYISFYFPNSLNSRMINISMSLNKATFPGKFQQLQMPVQTVQIQN